MSVRIQLTTAVHRSCLTHRGAIAAVDPYGRVPDLSEVINGLLTTKINEIEADDKLVIAYNPEQQRIAFWRSHIERHGRKP